MIIPTLQPNWLFSTICLIIIIIIIYNLLDHLDLDQISHPNFDHQSCCYPQSSVLTMPSAFTLIQRFSSYPYLMMIIAIATKQSIHNFSIISLPGVPRLSQHSAPDSLMLQVEQCTLEEYYPHPSYSREKFPGAANHILEVPHQPFPAPLCAPFLFRLLFLSLFSGVTSQLLRPN